MEAGIQGVVVDFSCKNQNVELKAASGDKRQPTGIEATALGIRGKLSNIQINGIIIVTTKRRCWSSQITV